MNYIKRLQYEMSRKNAEIEGLRNTIQGLKEHLCLPKFQWPNDYINVKDVFRILHAGETETLLMVDNVKRPDHRKRGE